MAGSRRHKHIQVYHPRPQACQRALKTLHSHVEDGLKYKARIVLPFPVQMHVEAKHNLGFPDSESRIVYIYLNAYVEMYVLVKDGTAFENT